MKGIPVLLGVFSDVHDNLDNLRLALKLFQEHQASELIFCGDFCSPIPARVMSAGFSGNIHCVFGNGDGDPFTIARLANSECPNLRLHGQYAQLDFASVKIAVTHYPLYGQALARLGDYSAVFSGHTHEVHEQRFEKCLWLNPGEVMGWKGRGTCALYETESNTAKILTL